MKIEWIKIEQDLEGSNDEDKRVNFLKGRETNSWHVGRDETPAKACEWSEKTK